MKTRLIQINVCTMVIILFVSLSFSVQAADAVTPLPKVAVKELAGKGVDKDTAATLTDVLCTRLMTHKKYNILCASDVRAILEATQQTALLGSCEGDACYDVLGKVLKAPYVISGTIGQVNKVLVLNLSLIATADQRVIKRVTHEISSKDSLIKGVRKAADLLAK